MRYTDFRIIETKLREAGEVYVIGDSHAKAMGGTNNLASDGARLSAIATQANNVPDGATVYMTGGHNDVAGGAQPQAIATQVQRIISTLEGKGCTVNYILFPEGSSNTNQAQMGPTRQKITSTVKVGKDLEGCSLSDGIHCQMSSYTGIVNANAGNSKPSKPAGDKQDRDNNVFNMEGGLEAGPPYPQDQVEAIKALQTRLEELGYSVGSTGIDGKYGPRTSRAVKAFQKDFGQATPPNAKYAGGAITADAIKAMATVKKKDKPTPTGNSSFDPRVANGDPNFVSPGYPSDMTTGVMEKIISDEAKLRGIDPSIAIRIFRAEGKGAYQSQVPRSGRGSLGGKEASFGPFQLYIGGGMGNDYQDATGRDLITDNTKEGITNQIRFALDQAVSGNGWQPWYGRGPAGVAQYAGLRGSKVLKNYS